MGKNEKGGTSQVAPVVKDPLPMKGTEEMQIGPLGREDPLEETPASPPVFLLENPKGRGA